MDGLSVSVRLSGAVVKGKAPEIVDTMLAGAVMEMAEYTKLAVDLRLHEVLKHPTGYYQSQIANQTITPNLHRIHDNMVIYGPWLEGVGSRNYPVTRFKGYRTFRMVRQQMQSRSKKIIEDYLRRVGEIL